MAKNHRVTIRDFMYLPDPVEIEVGDTVTWTNEDGDIHTATGSLGEFDTGNIPSGSCGS